jgi:arylsulfatase A-like enzyme
LLLSVLLVVYVGCSQRPESQSFYRFVEDIVPGDRWHETEVSIGHETRNVLFAPYRSNPIEIEVSGDGTVSLSAVAEIEKLSADAPGIRIAVQRLPLQGEPAKTDYVYVPLPAGRDVDILAEERGNVLPADGLTRSVKAWAREVIPLPQEHVTKTVRIPQSARLDFGIALEDEEPDAPVRFTVLAKRGGSRSAVFTQTLDPLSDEFRGGWVDARVDISELAGSEVRFVFRTEIVRDGGGEDGPETPSFISPVWSSPIMYWAEAVKEDDRPNVILISLDTLRADHLGCYGYHRATSPNIDKFAESAILFEYAIAPSPWTLPSHASLFTGLHPSVHQAGMYVRDDTNRPYWDYPLLQEEATFPELARQHGYLTAAYTEGGYVQAILGFSQGFDLYSDGTRVPTASGFVEETFGNALEWLKKYGNLPFLLFVHTYEIHAPYDPPRRFVEMFSKGYAGTGGLWAYEARSQADRIHCEDRYDGDIAYTDEVLARLFAELEKLGLLRDTAIVLFSDHGEEFWEHGRCGHRNTVYEEVIHVPLIIRLAGTHPPTGRVTRQVSLTDVYATVLELLGIDQDVPLDGMSLLPLIGSSKGGNTYERDIIVSEFTREDEAEESGRSRKWRLNSVRTEGEKYIQSSKTETEELYDLGADPGEQTNLAPGNQPRLEHYRGLLSSFLKTVRAGHAPPDPNRPKGQLLTEEDRRRLKALGYL